VKIKGYDGEDCSVTRSASNSYSSYMLQFDVTLDNMESPNYCEVSVRFGSSGSWSVVKSYQGSSTTETFENEVARFTNTGSSSSTLYIKLATNGDSSSGGDICYYDNVYLYGVGGSSSGTTTTTTTTSSGNCLLIERLSGLNGAWVQDGTKNGWPVYANGGRYLYMAEDEGEYWWTVESSKNAWTWDNGYCDTPDIDIMECDGNWWTGSAYDTNSIFRSCSAFSSNSLPCLEDNLFGDRLCLHTNHTFFDGMGGDGNGYFAFGTIEEEGCVNDYPVYRHTVSESVDQNETQFYLYYSDFGKWVISVDALYNDGEFECASQDLLECTRGAWKRWESRGDAEQLRVTQHVMLESCPLTSEEDVESDSKKRMSTAGQLGIILVVLLVLIAAGFGAFMCYRAKKAKKEVTFDHDQDNDVEVEYHDETNQTLNA